MEVVGNSASSHPRSPPTCSSHPLTQSHTFNSESHLIPIYTHSSPVVRPVLNQTALMGTLLLHAIQSPSPADMATTAQDLTQLAELLAGLGRLEEALDASRAATSMYQHSMGLPSNSSYVVPQCQCDILKTNQGAVVPDQRHHNFHSSSKKSFGLPKRHRWTSDLLGIDAIGSMFKVLR
ncbi:unnamed protein product [Rhizoctonia solani]|uniref:Uncharacterized protein n=1 Tax=Rhizoctonia solani TaxID=456999 RepID=A0A8H3DAJ4_9AGAM|nr:unnamed protein product [Rhizoctonia solani]